MAIKEGMDMKEWAEIFQDAQYVLVGLGTEWEEAPVSAYEDLEQALKGKDYFIVTINTDGNIFQSSLLKDRITAPCGDVYKRQPFVRVGTYPTRNFATLGPL